MRTFFYDGHWDCMRGHARRLGIKISTIERRVRAFGNRPENYAKILHVGKVSRRMMEYAGILDTRAGWAKRFNVSELAIYRNFPDGIMTDERVAKIMRRKRSSGRPNPGAKLLTYRGESHTIYGWAKVVGHTASCIRNRLKRGMSLGKALSRRNYNIRCAQTGRTHECKCRVAQVRREIRSLGIIV